MNGFNRKLKLVARKDFVIFIENLFVIKRMNLLSVNSEENLKRIRFSVFSHQSGYQNVSINDGIN